MAAVSDAVTDKDVVGKKRTVELRETEIGEGDVLRASPEAKSARVRVDLAAAFSRSPSPTYVPSSPAYSPGAKSDSDEDDEDDEKETEEKETEETKEKDDRDATAETEEREEK